jgi:hypothetical protein
MLQKFSHCDFDFLGAGTREIMCDDESAEALRMIIGAIKFTKHHFLTGGQMPDRWSLKAEETLEVLDFSKRCLMPWVGIRSALCAVKGSKDAKLLLGLAVRADMFDGVDITGEEASWQQVAHLAAQGIAGMIVEASRLPEFAKLSAETLEMVITNVKDDEWSEEQEVCVPVREADNQGPCKAPENSKGAELHWIYADWGMNLLACTNAGTMLDVMTLGIMKFAVMEISITIVAREGQNVVQLDHTHIALPTVPSGGCVCLQAALLKRFEHGNPPTYRNMFKSRISALHKQCLALVRFYAGMQGIAPEQASLEIVWRYFCRLMGSGTLANILRECMCRSFNGLRLVDASLFLKLSCAELEDIISEQKFLYLWNEIDALSLIIDWAMHKSNQPGGLKVGDQVRMRPACENVTRREADCEVKRVQGSCVEVQRVRTSSAENVDQVGLTETLQVTLEQLYDSGQTAMLKFLKHICFASISIESFGSCLSTEKLCYACVIPSFKTLLDRAIDVQTGKSNISIFGDKLTPRKGLVPGDGTNAAVFKLLDLITTNAQKRLKELTQKCEDLDQKLYAKTKEVSQLTAENEQKSQQITQLTEQLNQEQQQKRDQFEESFSRHMDSLPLEQLEAVVARRRGEMAIDGGTSDYVGTSKAQNHAKEAMIMADRPEPSAEERDAETAGVPGITAGTSADGSQDTGSANRDGISGQGGVSGLTEILPGKSATSDAGVDCEKDQKGAHSMSDKSGSEDTGASKRLNDSETEEGSQSKKPRTE